MTGVTPSAAAARGKFQVERRGNGHRQKFQIPKWSHQKELEGLIGKEVTITFNEPYYERAGDYARTSDQFVTGMLTAADAFTIQLAQGSKSVMTYFKHSIRGYSEKVA